MSFWKGLLGDENVAALNRAKPIVPLVQAFEAEMRALSDEGLKDRTRALRAELESGKTLDEIAPQAFALVREASTRTLRQRHFDVQLIGGMILHNGDIAEMRTGEGKTLVATLPAYLNALGGSGVHIVTVNDYLSRRDAVWMGQIYHLLGLSVGVINNDSSFLYDPSRVSENKAGESSKLQAPKKTQTPMIKVQNWMKFGTHWEAFMWSMSFFVRADGEMRMRPTLRMGRTTNLVLI